MSPLSILMGGGADLKFLVALLYYFMVKAISTHPPAYSAEQYASVSIYYLPIAFTTNKQATEQRYRDGIMNDFCVLV